MTNTTGRAGRPGGRFGCPLAHFWQPPSRNRRPSRKLSHSTNVVGLWNANRRFTETTSLRPCAHNRKTEAVLTPAEFGAYMAAETEKWGCRGAPDRRLRPRLPGPGGRRVTCNGGRDRPPFARCDK